MISFLIGRWCGGSGGNILGPQHIDLTLDEMLLYTLSLSLTLSLSDLLLLFEHLTYKQKVNLFECTDLRNCVVKIEMSPDYRI